MSCILGLSRIEGIPQAKPCSRTCDMSQQTCAGPDTATQLNFSNDRRHADALLGSTSVMRDGAHTERYGETAEHEVCASQLRPSIKHSRLYLCKSILLIVSGADLWREAASGRKPFSLKDSLEVVLGSSEAGRSTMRLWCGPEVRGMPRSRQKSVQGASFQRICSVRLNRFQGRRQRGEPN